MTDILCPDCGHILHNHNDTIDPWQSGCQMAKCACTNTPRMIRVIAERDELLEYKRLVDIEYDIQQKRACDAEADRDRYKATLEWYADPENYSEVAASLQWKASEIKDDGGEKARSALAGGEK